MSEAMVNISGKSLVLELDGGDRVADLAVFPAGTRFTLPAESPLLALGDWRDLTQAELTALIGEAVRVEYPPIVLQSSILKDYFNFE